LTAKDLRVAYAANPMLARCGSCGVGLVVPDDKAANPRLRVRCRCGSEFALREPKPSRVETPALCEQRVRSCCALGLAVFKKARELNLD